jgi:hypothetical protein
MYVLDAFLMTVVPWWVKAGYVGILPLEQLPRTGEIIEERGEEMQREKCRLSLSQQ